MTSPRLTIAIPFVDEAEVLADAIHSVFAQTFTDWELLLVDDGSRDGSLDIARSVRDPRVRVLSDGRRRRLSARLNQVIQVARGDLVARMDADDVMHPTRLAREIALLDAAPEVAAVGTFVAYYLGAQEQSLVGETWVPSRGQDALLQGAVPHATMVSRRSFSARFPYDETLDRAEDRDLFCRTFGLVRYAVVPEPLYVVRPRTHASGFVPNYMKSMEQNRLIYLRHGPRIAGLRATASAVVGSYARQAIYGVASRVSVGVIDTLVRRRGRPATMSEKTLVAEAFSATETAVVPGLSERAFARSTSPR